MRRRHAMPFGAEVEADGAVRFRLWAPRARTVEVVLDEGAPVGAIPMASRPGGWFEVRSQAAGPGSRYGFRVDGGPVVPDPASRSNPDGVHRPSEVVDPLAFRWQDDGWTGRPWREAVTYELHVGAFSPEGTFAGVERRLDYLAGLGATAVELMPVAAFPGRRNWGYDGVLPFAPDASYGRPEDLKGLVQAAHARGLMVLLDVVYNHFGPDGNYLHAYAREAFFSDRHHTPWGPGINFDGDDSPTVRAFFVHNALYWLEEYHLDGLRLDAVHAILDDSPVHILDAIADAVRAGPGSRRAVHLVLENDANQAKYLERRSGVRPRYDAQWNDDVHHALHVLLTGERDGYYADYGEAPLAHLARCLTEGFAYQGEPSMFRGGAPRGEPSEHLPPTAFVGFLQTHDQAGNRALGERIDALAPPEAVQAATVLLLLAPSPPLLFMGQEFAATSPFLFFCDFHDDLAEAVREGRRAEFAAFERFADPQARRTIPDPNAPETFDRSRLDWSGPDTPAGHHRLDLCRRLLALRHRAIVPHLDEGAAVPARYRLLGHGALWVRWDLADGVRLTVLANLGPTPVPPQGVDLPALEPLFAWPPGLAATAGAPLPAWSVLWHLAPRAGGP